MEIAFGEWLPDLPDYNNPGATVVKNCLPAGNSYRSMSDIEVYSSALTARCQGAFSAKDSAGNTSNFAGDASKLYKLSAGTYSDVSKVGGYTVSIDEQWAFTKFGERIIAANINDAMQSYVLGSSSAFADLSASAPKARCLAVVGSFVFAANTFDTSDGLVPHRLRNCAIGDPTTWTVSASTQANYYDLNATDGWIKQIVSGVYGVAFQERAISRFDFIGGASPFQISKVETNKGTLAPGSVVKLGNMIAYLGLDGFYMFDGNQSIPIGVNKVDRTFLAELDTSYLDRIYACIDFDNQCIRWAYPPNGSNGICTRVIIYHYAPNAQKRWSYSDNFSLEWIGNLFSEGYTLDTLDTVSASLDALSFSLDSRVWTGNDILLAGFNTDHKQVNFTGSAITATIETQEVQPFMPSKTNVKRLRPIVDGSGTTTLAVGTRNLLSDSTTWGSALSTDTFGYCTTRAHGRYIRGRATISGGFNDAIGMELVEFSKAGIR